jgi:2-dehydro-3-deoxygluconokinase
MLYDTASAKAVFAPQAGGRYSPYKINAIVDRIGGGDSFGAGLIYASLDKELSGGGGTTGGATGDETVLAFATAASCLCHSIYGDFNYASRAEVLSLMKGSTSGRIQR